MAQRTNRRKLGDTQYKLGGAEHLRCRVFGFSTCTLSVGNTPEQIPEHSDHPQDRHEEEEEEDLRSGTQIADKHEGPSATEFGVELGELAESTIRV